MEKVLVIVIFLITGNSLAVNVEYLRNVEERRQYTNSYRDYYFSCSVTGLVLQWGLNSASLGGYRVEDVGVTTVNNQSDFQYTSILLSALPVPQQSEFELGSVLVISVLTSSSLHLNVSCTNNVELRFTNITIFPKCLRGNGSIVSSINRTVVLEYVLSAPLVRNMSVLVHIFMCSTESPSQLIGRNNKAIGFGEKDELGATSSDLNRDNTMVNIQAILISRQPRETTSLVFILGDANFTAVCSFESNRVQLQARQLCSMVGPGTEPGFNTPTTKYKFFPSPHSNS